jgi:putative Mg2+ transporter-C (MgtC) family protein
MVSFLREFPKKERFDTMIEIDSEMEDILLKLAVSLIIGCIIGGEREYRNKSAGLRTIILICLGSTLFTILSAKIGDATGASRVAANIVTGIGFLGAGAIMRSGLTVSGMTTASTIWVAAALGMSVGAGEFAIAFYAMVFAIIVLTVFAYLQKVLSMLNRTIELHLTFEPGKYEIERVEQAMRKLDLRFTRVKEFRKDNAVLFQYEVVGKPTRIQQFASQLNKIDSIKSFGY